MRPGLLIADLAVDGPHDDAVEAHMAGRRYCDRCDGVNHQCPAPAKSGPGPFPIPLRAGTR